MSTKGVIAVILIVVGMLGLIQGGVTYYSNRDVVDFGGLRIQVDEARHLPLSPILGAIALVVGLYLLYGQKSGRNEPR